LARTRWQVGVAGLVDSMWPARPAVPRQPVVLHPLALSGESAGGKLQRFRAAVLDAGAQSAVVAALDQIAWLFNLRGSDIACNPVFFAYALVTSADAFLFLGRGAAAQAATQAASTSGAWGWLGEGVEASLEEAQVSLRPYDSFFTALPLLLAAHADRAATAAATAAATTAATAAAATAAPATAASASAAVSNPSAASPAVLVEKGGGCSMAVAAALSGLRRVEADVSPLQAFKARKNSAEATAARKAWSTRRPWWRA
jgi:Xaa-Pro aminopeptidase